MSYEAMRKIMIRNNYKLLSITLMLLLFTSLPGQAASTDSEYKKLKETLTLEEVVVTQKRLTWYNGHMRSPLFKTGDVVRLTEHYNNKIYPGEPMILLCLVYHTVQGIVYELLAGDIKMFFYERCLELVQDI